LFEQALEDLQVAVKLCPTNPDVKKLMNKVNDDVYLRSGTSNNTSSLKARERAPTTVVGLVKSQTRTKFTQSQSNLIESPPL
jgi:hypothetical protein